MKLNLIKSLAFIGLLGSWIFWGCDNKLAPISQAETFPPDLNRESVFESFSPDSGGIGTQLIIRGQNFGSDTSYLKVTVNNKKATIIKAEDDIIYAIVPARADMGYVRLYVGRDNCVEEYASTTKFRYQFKRNVTTLMGKHGEPGRDDGGYTSSKLQRPWALLTDRDGTLFFIDEGRGQKQNGALRRAKEGIIETLVQCSDGPFQSPTCLALSPKQDTLYISNYSFTSEATDVKTDFNIIYVTRDGGFMDIRGLCKFVKGGTQGIAVHPKTGELFFNNMGTGYIYRFTGPGYEDYTPLFKVNNADNTKMRMMFNPEGTILYMVVQNRHCIYKVSYNAESRTFGMPELFAGAWDESGYMNGTGATARFDTPGQPSFDEDGNMFVPDKGKHIIRKITPSGEVSLYAGIPDKSGFGDGLPDEAKFNKPEAVTVYPDNSVYVADRDNHVIRRVTIE
ncbi:IPT/TIG domain-containing protein [Bacteroides sp. 224]|uniref:IPT/TIG domain-containing protein n=1 Tax=Bacteroides sp. 224 TaxID=2302936 RepID=UPI0013D23828|nr:IPT/TIG domain-containing protein [Bacteroides sp. 224]NDV63669.1 phospholipase [Bacteroides sp. 224]